MTFALMATVFSQETVKIPVKRVHSRQRRFIAPGAVWDMMFGLESIGSDFEARYDLVIHYRMDYLFGGTAALAGAIAQSDAAAEAGAQANADAQAALGKRKKRSRLVFYIFILSDRNLGEFMRLQDHNFEGINNSSSFFCIV